MAGWLGVVSAEHVRQAVALGIGQAGHGKRAPLARMHAGDLLLYYSPVERLGDGVPLRQFTAFGTVADDEIWQVEERGFQPYRRRVAYESVRPVGVDEVRNRLQLTAAPNWGYQLRRGVVPLADADVAVLREAMLVA
ncbi:MAG TPA: EVE domain-containing protein [Naasia sp.]